jgi:hypothetical protein
VNGQPFKTRTTGKPHTQPAEGNMMDKAILYQGYEKDATRGPWPLVFIYHKARIEAQVQNGGLIYRSYTSGEACHLEDVSAGILIEDDRRSVCIAVLQELIKDREQNVLAIWNEDPDTVRLTVDYSNIPLQGKAAVILLTAARLYAGSLDDLTRTTWEDLVKMIPGLDNYEY